MEYEDLIFNIVAVLLIVSFLTFIINELILLWKRIKKD